VLNSLGSRRRQSGLSLIELMVGITVGMIVVAGASLMMTNQVSEHRRLTLETQIQQDLRATADLMLKEVRRAGSWAVPQNGVWAPPAAGSPFVAPVANPYIRRLSVTQSEGGDELRYSYSRKKERFNDASAFENNLVNEGTELFGFKLEQGIIKFLLGGSWQPMTDPSVLLVTGMQITLNTQESNLADSCENVCLPATGTCPKLLQRSVTIRISGRSAHDAAVTRDLQVSARVRNDELAGACS